jgi:hypothetical protein
MHGTYHNITKLLPTSIQTEELKEAVNAQEYKDSGGKISCGHDFWDKDIEYGEVVYCNRCHQFFTKIKVLPWITTRGPYNFEKDEEDEKLHYGTNHLKCSCYVAVPLRIT